jgi:hypothetical protein
VNTWSIPRYEPPTRPTLPVLFGSSAAQRTSSAPSSASCFPNSCDCPSEPPVPATSTTTPR